jgi:hypothetical protein
MPKRLFVSYCHKQGQWVVERLLPVLRAAGCEEVFVDRERFTAGRGVVGQMDHWQDRAEVSLLVLSPDYLASDYCRHEMDRAIASDPDFVADKVLPVVRVACDPAAFSSRPNPPLWVDLTDDRRPEGWALLLRTLAADRLRASVPHWLGVRDELVAKLRDQQQSVNLVVRGEPNWRALRDHLQQDFLPQLALVDLNDPATATLDGFVRQILLACGDHSPVPRGKRSVEALNAIKGWPGVVYLALTGFDNVRAREKAYGPEPFFAFCHLLESRKLVLLIESRTSLWELLPKEHPLSNLHRYLHQVELNEAGA